MHTGTPAELREREQRARQIAQQVATLLNQIRDLGGHPAMGNLIIPGVDIRCSGGTWSVR
ncbi:hypothetical protein [Streptomyces sp. NPDC020983]|uniref:hypothetical protein n=1 Tax=Streptomyces sp. NPDC020983 TaxID=3365106 RepID=UPI0037AF3831